MASNLSKRLDKLEKGIQAFLEEKKEKTPLYVSQGEPVPEGATVIVMQWVEAEHQEDDLEQGQSLGDGQSAAALGENSAQRKTPSTFPPLETPAERDKRWKKHLQAIDMRGERYTGDQSHDPRREDMRRGIV